MFTLVELSAAKTLQDIFNASEKSAKITAYQRVKNIIGIVVDLLTLAVVVREIRDIIQGSDRNTLHWERELTTSPFSIYKVGLRLSQDGAAHRWAGISLDIAGSEGHSKALPLKLGFAINLNTGQVSFSAGVNIKLYQSALFKLQLALRGGRGFGLDNGLTNRSSVALVVIAPGSLKLGGFSVRSQWKLTGGDGDASD